MVTGIRSAGRISVLALAIVAALAAETDRALAQSGAGFRFGIGRQSPGGPYGAALAPALDAEATVLYAVRGARLGVGWNWASFPSAVSPDTSWNQLRGHITAGYGFSFAQKWSGWADGRWTFLRIRPEASRYFDPGPATSHPPHVRATGRGVGVAVGLEYLFTERTALELSSSWSRFEGKGELVDYGLPVVDPGRAWRLHLGLSWFEDRRTDMASNPGRASSATPDAWGVTRALGRGVGVASFGLLIPWAVNEYIRDRRFAWISPRSWRRGIAQGFGWDDNDFAVNYFQHPYHGHLYYSGARSNGFGYWGSFVFSVVGSWLWECCTETHLASTPDMINTGIGGATVGEASYRLSSLILDNTASGGERVGREILGALIDLPRAGSRIISGRAWRKGSNPLDPSDHIPGQLDFAVTAGVRRVPTEYGAGARGSRAAIELRVESGDAFDRLRRPFDHYEARVRLIPGEEATPATIEIRGTLASARSASERSALLLTQEFELENTTAYRRAGQAFSGTLLHKVPLSEQLDLQASAAGVITVIGSVDASHAAGAEIPGIQERIRLYDFGWGPSARLSLGLRDGARTLVGVEGLAARLVTLHGSNFDGFDAHHTTYRIRGTIDLPLSGPVGIGASWEEYVTLGRFENPELTGTRQSRSEGTFFLSWRPTF